MSSELVQGLLSFAHMSLPIMCLNFWWLQMSLRSLCLLSVRSLMLWILPCIPQCCHLLHVGSCRSIWKTLRTSLHVLILHPIHYSSCTGTVLPFLLGHFLISWRICINDVAQRCHITRVCLRPLELSSYYSSFWIISWIVITCSLEQVSSFSSCRRLYAIFPISQMH